MKLATVLIGCWAIAAGACLGEEPDAAFSVAAVLRDREAFDRPHDIELRGELAFVPGKGGSLAIVDLANPEKPRLLYQQHDARELAEAETVLFAKGWLYLGTHDLHAIDVSQPEKPVFQGRVSDRKRIAHINGMVCRGETIFAANKHGWLNAFDLRQPAKPSLAGAVNLREKYGVSSPHDVDLFREFAVVADPAKFDPRKQAGKLALIRVFEADQRTLLPDEKWELAGEVETVELAGANRVQVSGNYAFVGVSTKARGGRLAVVDLSDPGSPQQVATLPFAPEDGWGPNGLTVTGSVVFLAGGQSVEAIDIRDPKRPVKLASQRFANILANANPRGDGGGDSGHDLVYREGLLYVTGQNDHCLLVLRVNSAEVRALAGG